MGLLEACALASSDRGLHLSAPVARPSWRMTGFGAAHHPVATACPELTPSGPSLRGPGFSFCFHLLFYRCAMSSAGKSSVRFQGSWLHVPGLCRGDSGQLALAEAGQAGLVHLSWQHRELHRSPFAVAGSGSSPLCGDREGAEFGGAQREGGGHPAGLGAWELGFTLQQGFSRTRSPVPPRESRCPGVQSRTKCEKTGVQQQKGWQRNQVPENGLAVLLLCPGPVASPARAGDLCVETMEKKPRRINQSVTAKCFS